MELKEKCAYIKGLMEGLELDTTTKEGKVINAMMELLTELTSTVTALDDELDQVYDELDAIDEDMDDLEEAGYGDEDDDEENGDEAEEALMSEEIHCQNCGAAFDIEFGVCDPEDAPCEPRRMRSNFPLCSLQTADTQ